MVIGILLGLIAGVTLGGITSFAALSYDYGATPISLVFFRAIIALAVTIGLTLINREKLWCGWAGLQHALFAGISLSLVGFGYMAAVAFITPGLAVAVLYLFPLIVLGVESFGQRQWPPLKTLLAFGVALGGIILCLGLTFDNLDWRGVLLGVMAALGMSGYLLASSRFTKAGFGYAPLVWANVFVMITAIVMALPFGGIQQLALPASSTGLAAMLVAAGLYSIGMIFSFIALRFVTAAVVALMMNVEPITTLIAARLIVAEDLSWLQYTGMVIAIMGITLGGTGNQQKNTKD